MEHINAVEDVKNDTNKRYDGNIEFLSVSNDLIRLAIGTRKTI